MSEHPTGQFLAEIVDHGYSKTSKGNDQLVVKFKTEHGNITGYFGMTDASIEYTLEKIENMGYTGSDLRELGNSTVLVTNKCEIVVENDTYEGKTKPKVSWVYPEGGGGVKKDDEATANVARFNAILKSRQKNASKLPI